MGILTDFVIAGRDEAMKVGESDVPSQGFPESMRKAWIK